MQRDQLTTPERARIEADQQRPTQGNAGIPSEPTEPVDMEKPISVNADAAAPREGGDIDSQGSGSGTIQAAPEPNGCERRPAGILPRSEAPEPNTLVDPDNSWVRAGEAARASIAKLKRIDTPDGLVMASARPVLKTLAVWPTWLRPLFARWLKTSMTRAS